MNKNKERRKKMGTIIWIFHYVVPWFWLVTTIIFFIVAIFKVCARYNGDSYDGAFDFVIMETDGTVLLPGFIGILIAAVAVFLIQKRKKKVYRWPSRN